jgi:hypothetical protein
VAAGVFVACVLVRPIAGAQATAPPAQPQTAAERFKNIQVLKDVPADQFDSAMRYVAASLGVQCGFCHVFGPQGGFDKDDKENKQTARKMMRMVMAINEANFDGRQVVSCATCHQGHNHPQRTPPILSPMTPDEAAEAAAAREQRQGRGAQAQGAPAERRVRPTESVDQVIDKFVAALGGRDALQKVTSATLHGTMTTRGGRSSSVTVEQTARRQYREDVQEGESTSTRTFDGTAAWSAARGRARDLEGLLAAQVERQANLRLALDMKDWFSNLSVDEYSRLDGHEVVVLSGRSKPNVIEELSFDRDSGLLRRRSIVTRTPLGPLAERIDYDDYRAVDGVKLPFRVTHASWDGIETTTFSDAALNTPISESRFAKPDAGH